MKDGVELSKPVHQPWISQNGEATGAYIQQHPHVLWLSKLFFSDFSLYHDPIRIIVGKRTNGSLNIFFAPRNSVHVVKRESPMGHGILNIALEGEGVIEAFQTI